MQKKSILFCVVLFTALSGKTQWKEVAEPTLRSANSTRKITPVRYRVFQLVNEVLQRQLQQAPKEFAAGTTPAVLLLPMPDGTVQRFSVFNSPVMDPALQQKFPEIKTWSGQGIDDPYATARIDWNPHTGFHARILSPKGDVYVDPYWWNNKDYVQSYYQKDLPQKEAFLERPIKQVATNKRTGSQLRTAASAPCRGTQLFTYRAAISCTGEYAQAVTGKTTPTKAEVMAAIVTTMNRVNQVYERDLTIRLILVADNDLVVYTDPETDPYAGNDDASTLLEESRTHIPAKIGVANFDIGHTFSTGAGGVAYLGVVCVNDYKAGGVTGRANPKGDAYDIDYVAHEIGHQFGGNHTFRGTNGSCAGNGNYGTEPLGSYTAYEPGSGTSIQAYAGICLTDNIQPNSDPYFHAISYDEIINYVTTGNGKNCKGIINTGNAIPVITDMAFNGSSIPVGTPFTLSATATDANGDPLTYSWEQWEAGKAPLTYNNADGYADGDAIWRSRVPSVNNKRTIPDIRYVAANYPVNPSSQMDGFRGEVLSTKTRSYSFKLTVRDNKAGGGGVATGGGKPVDPVTNEGGVGCSFTTPFSINVVAGTFAVAMPNGGETYNGGSPVTINWTNTGTTEAPINCATVRILLSTDGGLTYPVVLVNNTANDGTEQVVLPNIPTTSKARVRVEAADNIFFDISNANFIVMNNTTLPVGLKEFTVKPQGRNNALLQWSTAMELENHGFEVERSIGNTGAFKTIGFKKGNSSGSEYSYADENLPLNVNVYYRLRQVDLSGQSRVTETKLVRFSDKAVYLSMQPNPAKDVVTIANNGNNIAKARVQITDATGRVVKDMITPLDQTTRIDLSLLAKGFYTVRISAGSDVLLTTKLVKE